ncbi:MAG: hypothetical protein ACLBM1_10685 [Cuspidothrix sp.]|jgi:hypothetical protein
MITVCGLWRVIAFPMLWLVESDRVSDLVVCGERSLFWCLVVGAIAFPMLLVMESDRISGVR